MSQRHSTARTALAASVAFCLALGLAGCGQAPNGAAESDITLSLDRVSPEDLTATEDFSWLEVTETTKKNLLGWYDYERQVPSDVRTQDELLGFGFQACKNIAAHANGLEALERAMSKTYGLTISGAQAVIRAALETICHPLDSGYKTNFDVKVAEFQYDALADSRINWRSPPPPEWDFGNFMRGSCAQYKVNGPGNLDVYMFEHQRDYPLINGTPDTSLIRLLLSHSMWPGCGQFYTP